MLYSGIIKNWQIHTLSVDKKEIKKLYPKDNLQPLILTGTVVKDYKQRWLPGYHMRSSLICFHDKENNLIYTKNSIYKLQGPSGDDRVFNLDDPNKKDLGDFVLSLFY